MKLSEELRRLAEGETPGPQEVDADVRTAINRLLQEETEYAENAATLIAALRNDLIEIRAALAAKEKNDGNE